MISFNRCLVIWVTLVLTVALAEDKLLMVQVMWRHGDRTPTMTFKKDPNQESAWPLGWGQLTPEGMEQHMILGNLLYQKYVIETKFLNTSYKFNEMYVRTTDVNRTYISAYSNIFGMYYNRTQSIPGTNFPSNPRWPGFLVPFPVHANVDYEHDYIGNPLAVCPRREWLWSKAKETPELKKLQKENDQFLKDLSVITGSTITLDNLWYVRDAIFIEKLHNKTDRLINDTTYKRIDEIVDKMENYEDGLDLTPVDNINFTVEIAKVRGGGALWAFMNHFELKLFCNDSKNQNKPQCNWMKHMRYYAFSAHDNALSALMATLGAKEKLVPYGYPEYSACLALELWLTSKGPAIRMLYHANDSTGFEDVTRNIAGCENLSSDKCDYNIVLKTAKIFYPGKDQENVLCQDTTSPNTDMWTYTKASSASPASSASSASPASSASLASSAGSTFSVNASLLSALMMIAMSWMKMQ